MHYNSANGTRIDVHQPGNIWFYETKCMYVLAIAVKIAVTWIYRQVK